MLNLRRSFLLLLMVLCLIVIFQNSEVVKVKFLFWSQELSKSIFFFLLLFCGFVFGWIGHLVHLRRRR